MPISNLDTKDKTLSSTGGGGNYSILQNITTGRILKNLIKNKKPKGPLPTTQS